MDPIAGTSLEALFRVDRRRSLAPESGREAGHSGREFQRESPSLQQLTRRLFILATITQARLRLVVNDAGSDAGDRRSNIVTDVHLEVGGLDHAGLNHMARDCANFFALVEA